MGLLNWLPNFHCLYTIRLGVIMESVTLDYMLLLTAHGTFVGSLRLEALKPTQIPIDTTISFGASTRTYTLRYIRWGDWIPLETG